MRKPEEYIKTNFAGKKIFYLNMNFKHDKHLAFYYTINETAQRYVQHENRLQHIRNIGIKKKSIKNRYEPLLSIFSFWKSPFILIFI
jgi:hypothetical protein